jgi:DNA-binding MarR family transcriptional regulator
MANMTLDEFADRVDEIMPQVTREFFRHETSEFYKMKVTLPQFVVMNILYTVGESKMTDISRSAGVTTAAMTGLVDRLVKYAYVKRSSDPKDRRIVKIALTGEGSMTVKKMLDHRKKVVMKIFGLVSEAERDEYLRILTNIRDRLKENSLVRR